jgi:tagatose 6-phosphate kinase
MITAVSLNSAVDRRVLVETLARGTVLRASEMHEKEGGKGINVANAARELGARVAITGFVAGRRGHFIKEALRRKGIAARWIHVPGESRVCLAIIETGSDAITEILEPGPRIPQRAVRSLYRVLEQLARRSRIVALSGSLPSDIDPRCYAQLIRICRHAGARTLLDTSGEALAEGIKAAPTILRINEQEAAALVGYALDSDSPRRRAVQWIANQGVEAPLVSQGARGAFFLYRGRMGRIRVPRFKTLNPVGAGDCMAAGIAAALDAGKPLEEALVWGAASGTACVLTAETATVRKKDVMRVKKEISIRWD